MKLFKEQISNGIWMLAIVLILFTPVRFHLQVLVNKLVATRADVIDLDARNSLEDYRWNLMSLEGEPLNFATKKGEVILINFWATWCPPCVAELPSLAALYSDYGEKVTFAFVANDERMKVATFLKKKGYRLPVYFEASKTPDALLNKSIPATYILDRLGNIVVEEVGAAKWNSKNIRVLLDSLIVQ